MRSRGVQNAAERGRPGSKNLDGVKGRLEAWYPLEIPQNRQSFVWKGLEQNTRVLEKLGKRLGGCLYSATVGSRRQQPPIALDRHCEERSCEATQDSFRTERRSNE